MTSNSRWVDSALSLGATQRGAVVHSEDNRLRLDRNPIIAFFEAFFSPNGNYFVFNVLIWLAASHFTFTVFLKYILADEIFCTGCRSYPFFLVAYYGTPFLAISLLIIIMHSSQVIRDMEPKFQLPKYEYLILGVCGTLYHVLRIASLQFGYMSAGLFLMIFQLESLFSSILGCFILRRKLPSIEQFATQVFSVCAILIFMLLEWDSVNQEIDYYTHTTSDIEPIMYAFFSAFFSALKACLTRRFIVQRECARRRKMFDEDTFKDMHQHLFYNHSDLYLSKMDDLFDSRFFDTESFSHSIKDTLVMEAYGTGLLLAPTALMVSFFNGETPACYNDFADARALPIGLLTFLAFALPFSCVGNLQIAVQSRSTRFGAWKMMGLFFGVIGAALWIPERWDLSKTVAIALSITAFMQYKFTIDGQRHKNFLEHALSEITSVFPEFTKEDVNGVRRIFATLGFETFQRVLYDIILNGQLDAWKFTASSWISIKEAFERPRVKFANARSQQQPTRFSGNPSTENGTDGSGNFVSGDYTDDPNSNNNNGQSSMMQARPPNSGFGDPTALPPSGFAGGRAGSMRRLVRGSSLQQVPSTMGNRSYGGPGNSNAPGGMSTLDRTQTDRISVSALLGGNSGFGFGNEGTGRGDMSGMQFRSPERGTGEYVLSPTSMRKNVDPRSPNLMDSPDVSRSMAPNVGGGVPVRPPMFEEEDGVSVDFSARRRG